MFLLGILRLIYLRDIAFYIHRLWAFYFLFFALLLLFIEAESRPAQRSVQVLIYHGGKALTNWFLACMAFFNVDFLGNHWWEYAIGIIIGLVAAQQTLVAVVYPNEERERAERRIKAIEEEDLREREEEKKAA